MVIVTTAVYWGFNSPLRPTSGLTGPLNLPAPGRRQSIYINFTFSHGPVFLINSRTPLFSAAPPAYTTSEAPLLPKLRGHFAEFLNHSSPERLSILNLTTCVGLGYGPNMHSLEAFLDSTSTPHSPCTGYASRLRYSTRIYQWHQPQRLHQQSTKRRGCPTASPHHLDHRSGPTNSTYQHTQKGHNQ